MQHWALAFTVAASLSRILCSVLLCTRDWKLAEFRVGQGSDLVPGTEAHATLERKLLQGALACFAGCFKLGSSGNASCMGCFLSVSFTLLLCEEMKLLVVRGIQISQS